MYSVHDHVINVRDNNDYRLVSIIDRAADLTALSVLVSRLPTGIVRGQTVTISDDRLSVLPGTVGSGISVSLRPTGSPSVFSGSISDTIADGFRIAVCRRLLLIRDAVLIHGSPDGLREVCRASPGGATGVRRPRSVFVQRALEVVGAIDDGGPSVDLSGLVGLGVGFTPSGDDFIMGFMAAGSAASFGSANLDPEAVREQLRGTTVGGATLVCLALDGSFPSYMCEFVDELRGSVAQAVIRAVRHGESSGTDALAGFVCGLALICAADNLTNNGGRSIVSS